MELLRMAGRELPAWRGQTERTLPYLSLQFEHEKCWHPELAEPEDIFPAFVKWVRGVFG